ncbi:calpain-like cysteine peptidase, partial [Trypanosoma conorhini]
PEGVPLEILPLDEDPKFHQMEAERAKLKAQDPRRNERKVADLENAMNDRCHELACDQLREDLAGVDKEPRDIPLELLHPHGDPAFAALVSDIRELKKDRRKNADAIEGIVRAMNGRADALAAAQLDRGFLDPEPAGVPLEILSLDADDAFHAAETERARLKLSDPRRNAGKIKELEDDMNARAHVLAGELKEKEREIFLDPQPGGVPVSELPLDSDESFHTMEVERLRLRNEDPRGN